MKKKIILIILSIIALVILTIVVINGVNQQNNIKKEKETIDIMNVFGIEDIENCENVKIIKSKDYTISSKYTVSSGDVYEANANINYFGNLGKQYYVRNESNKLNIFSLEYDCNKMESKIPRISENIKIFKLNAGSVVNSLLQEPTSEKLYGESTVDGPIPLEESIYIEKRLYSETHEVKDGDNIKKYDVNFYMKNDNILICELVYVL